jgi:HAD superfamily hydrolase (TIGR01549 family)
MADTRRLNLQDGMEGTGVIDTLLFDLDGTLLPFDVEPFMEGYFARLAPLLTDFYQPADVARWLLVALQQVVENEHPSQTNMDKFRKALFDKQPALEEQVWPIFEHFYTSSFEELQHLTKPTAIAREICRTAADKGYRLVLATNPVFPETATRARMRWAGIDEVPFSLVTTMENSHFCKPNPKYFLEVLQQIDATPETCLMVGNDVQEDGAAGYVGLQTYLVTDHLIDREVGTFHFDHRGTLEELQRFVEQLPVV